MIKTLFIAAFMLAAVPAIAQDTPATGEAAADEAALSAEAMALAKTNYDDFCAACHAANGSGDIGPSLRGNGKLADPAFVYRQIARGGSEMPGFVDVLSTEEVLALANYVRNNFGNDYGPVTAEDAGIAE